VAGEHADYRAAPDPAAVTASRKHLTNTFAVGMDRLLWDLEKRLLPDTQAVNAVIGEYRLGRPADAYSFGAALVLLQSMRLELDRLEADVFGAALGSGMSYEALAAVLDLPDAAAARRREDYLTERRQLPMAPAPAQQPSAHGPAEAAALAGRRANEAADRARTAALRREELGRPRQGAQTSRTDAAQAAANASDAKGHAGEAAERVAMGLLRAANALDRCAAKCLELGGDADPLLVQRAKEYTDGARRYREMAARHLDTGGMFSDSGPPPALRGGSG